MQGAMMKSMIGSKMDKLKPKGTGAEEETSSVDWKDFNYPPFCKLIHFKVADIPDPAQRKWGTILHYTFLSWVLFYAINFLMCVLGCVIDFNTFGFMGLIYCVFHAF
jgi:hypothetical protein